MNHKEIFNALLNGHTLLARSRSDASFIHFIKLNEAGELAQQYNFEGAKFETGAAEIALSIYSYEVSEYADKESKQDAMDNLFERLDKEEINLYTDGREIRLFFGNKPEIKTDNFTTLTKID